MKERRLVLTLKNFIFLFQSFFGFGQSAEIDIILDGAATRRTTEVKTEDGKKERLFLFFDGESLSGKVNNFVYINCSHHSL